MATASAPPQTEVKTTRGVLIGCGAFTLGLAAIIATTIKLTGGWFYPLDDAYIGMSIAKHLALYGIWGTSSQFASATSTPGFVALLAISYKVFGISQYTPLILTFASCIGVIFVCAKSFRLRAWETLLVVALTPLWTMAALGMEHALQILLCLIFLNLAARTIANRQPLDWKILLIAALAVSVRYEGLFVVAGACPLLLPKRWKSCIVLACAGWFPVGVFGLYFKLHGGAWLPNSVLLKGGAGMYRIFGFIERGFHMAPLMLLAAWLAWRYRRSLTSSRAKAALGITTVALWLHFVFADYGWIYRYEAYLIALGVVTLLLCYRESLLSKGQLSLGVIALLFLTGHAVVATVNPPSCSRAFHVQQFQTAKLLRSYPVSTALNDLGAPTYFSNAPVLDLVGLGSQDVFRARYHRPYTTEVLSELLAAHHVQAVAVYDSWFRKHPKSGFGGPPLPSNYIRVATLYTPEAGDFVGDDTVSYYALRGTEGKLSAALHRLQIPSSDRLTFAHIQFNPEVTP